MAYRGDSFDSEYGGISHGRLGLFGDGGIFTLYCFKTLFFVKKHSCDIVVVLVCLTLDEIFVRLNDIKCNKSIFQRD